MRLMLAGSLFASLSLVAAACGGDDPPVGPDASIDAAATVDAPAGGATCADYCAQIETSCVAANDMYITSAQCLASCEAFPAGTDGDIAGNSLACRDYHAGVAAGDADTHCIHAGPGGDGTCGNDCDGFCAIVMNSCTGGNQAYADTTACMNACALFDTTATYVAGATGDNLACRLYHATAAAENPGLHCEHTQPVSATCVN